MSHTSGNKMCKYYPLDETPMSHKLYDTKERNQAQGILKDCTQCSSRKKRRCLAKNINEGKNIHFSPMRKRRFIDQGALRPPPQIPRGQKINGHTFKVEISNKKVSGRTHFKIIHLIYGRIIDRYQQQIHS